MNALRYTREVDLNDTNNPHSLGVLLVPPGSRVLDVGSGAGHVAQSLKERGSRIWAVEIDPVAAGIAEEHCERVVIGDVEGLDLAEAFHDLSFDAILFLDVLEHLRRPADVLRACRPLLAEDGVVVASIPNVTHAALRLELLYGRFRYRDLGLLDRTHLRFFDAEEVRSLFRDAGFDIVADLRVTKNVDQTEFDIDLATIPPDVLQAATADEDAMTYQFVVVAAPMQDGVLPRQLAREAPLLERLQRERDELKRQFDQAHREFRAVLQEHADALQRMTDEHKTLQRELGIKDEYISSLRSRIGLGDAGTNPAGELILDATRYRLVDALNAQLLRVRPVHRALRWAASKALRSRS